MSTVQDICNKLEKGELVVLDTSSFDGAAEILIGSIIATDILARYKRYNLEGSLSNKPVISIILEEAPRVLGKEILESGPNIFSTIAREGRKFQIGLTAITQLPSLIPREILANMNTKIILGLEMKPERQAMIESASQDLSTDDRAIASLDKGEAIVTSTFVPFALPIKIPKFQPTKPVQKSFGGVKFG
jgi:DNA helicase HerA-like ATPase